MERRPRRVESGQRWKPVDAIDVVIVEDDRDLRDTMCELLVGRRMVVRAFAAVPEALDAISERMPDVVVTDLALPGRRGDELASTLRMDRTTSHLVLIAVSGAVEPSWEIVRWFDAYLRKPADIGFLGDLVESLRESTRAAGDRARRRTPSSI